MFNKIKIKKFLPYLFLILILGGMVFVPIHKAHAGLWETLTNPSKALVGFLAAIAQLVLWMVSWLLWVAGHLFNYALNLTLSKDIFGLTVIGTGWEVSRDLVNIFFIFILLYIAIATILQIAGYGIKDLLVKVIIIALLVNFSLVITKVVIDASNILAMEFYSQMGKDISATMMKGLNLATIYDGKKLKDPETGEDKISALTVIIVGLGGAALMLVTTFVFLAATALFAIRTVYLLFLMILSPLAFMAMILPSTKKYASQWWEKLFSQAFFAPAFMFMIYLVVKIISDDGFKASISAGSAGSTGIVVDASASLSATMSSKDAGALGVLVHFIILIGLMIGSLIVASKMGAVGASTAISYGQIARKWGQGYAGGKIKRGTGFVSEKMLNEKSWINQGGGGRIQGAIRGTVKTIRSVPMVDRGLAKASSWREQQMKAEEGKYKKQYGSYSEAGLDAVSGIQDGMTAKTLKKFGMKDVKGEVIKSVEEKRQSDKVKKERKEANKKAEDDEYNKIIDRQKSSLFGTKETDELKNELVKIENSLDELADKPMKEEQKERVITIEAELSGLTNIPAEAIKADPKLQTEQNNINNKRKGLIMERDAIKQEHQDDIKKEKMELRMKKGAINMAIGDKEKMRQIEENRERRIDTEKIEERVSKVESASGEKREPPPNKKT